MNEWQQHMNKKQLVIILLAIVIVIAIASIIIISTNCNRDTDNKEITHSEIQAESTTSKQSEFNVEEANYGEPQPIEINNTPQTSEPQDNSNANEAEETPKADIAGSSEPVPIPEELKEPEPAPEPEPTPEPANNYDPDFWAGYDSSWEGVEINPERNGKGGYQGWTW